jgi:hypothetical protein
MTTGIVHLAGFEVRFGERLRQRCAWCGEVMVDQELALTDNMVVFPAAKQVLHDGVLWIVLDDVPAELPGSVNVDLRSCMRVPPELTIATKGESDV